MAKLRTSGSHIHLPETQSTKAELIELDVLIRGTIIPAIKSTANITRGMLRRKQAD